MLLEGTMDLIIIIILVISDLRHAVDEICALVGYYTVYGKNSMPVFWYNL